VLARILRVLGAGRCAPTADNAVVRRQLVAACPLGAGVGGAEEPVVTISATPPASVVPALLANTIGVASPFDADSVLAPPTFGALATFVSAAIGAALFFRTFGNAYAHALGRAEAARRALPAFSATAVVSALLALASRFAWTGDTEAVLAATVGGAIAAHATAVVVSALLARTVLGVVTARSLETDLPGAALNAILQQSP